MRPESGRYPLTPFKDGLRVPPVMRPSVDGELVVRAMAARVRLHSELPLSDVWTYEGHLPGPTIEVRRGQRVRVEWVNDLPGDAAYPVTAATAHGSGHEGDEIAQNVPGARGARVLHAVHNLRPWTVVHVHGARVPGIYDGWAENGALSGQSTSGVYENDQRSTMLWYHDHAMGITRLNVYAGLAGIWLVRDDEEDALALPGGPYEIPLLIQDRNLDTDEHGKLTGRLLHKIEDGAMEFYGPFTLVNGTIWPYVEVEPRQYRLRLLNGSNARTYRLMLIDEGGAPAWRAAKQIGTDGGLLRAPVKIPDGGLVLASAERADVIVDFRGHAGKRLRLVNTACVPFVGGAADVVPGASHPEGKLPYPEVMEFRVSADAVEDTFALPDVLSDVRRTECPKFDHGYVERFVALVWEPDGALRLRELAELAPGEESHGPIVELVDERGVTSRYRTLAKDFSGATNWFVAYGSTEVWKVLNLSIDTHPFHIHLVNFQAVARDVYDTSGFDAISGSTTSPVRFREQGTLDENEQGWKDTIRVNPGELLTLVATFDGYTGRFIYHCHLLEHEDHDMMRPFVVMPGDAIAAMRGHAAEHGVGG